MPFQCLQEPTCHPCPVFCRHCSHSHCLLCPDPCKARLKAVSTSQSAAVSFWHPVVAPGATVDHPRTRNGVPHRFFFLLCAVISDIYDLLSVFEAHVMSPVVALLFCNPICFRPSCTAVLYPLIHSHGLCCSSRSGGPHSPPPQASLSKKILPPLQKIEWICKSLPKVWILIFWNFFANYLQYTTQLSLCIMNLLRKPLRLRDISLSSAQFGPFNEGKFSPRRAISNFGGWKMYN